MNLKAWHIRFNKIDGIIRIYDGTSYLTFFGSENMTLFTTDLDISFDSLPIEKILTLYVIIHIKSVLNKDKNHYYYIFSRKMLLSVS